MQAQSCFVRRPKALGNANKVVASSPRGCGLQAQSRFVPRPGALANANTVFVSPPRGGGLRAQSHFSPRLGPWVERIGLSFHRLKEVACELNLALYPGRGPLGNENRVAASPPRGGGLRAQSYFSPRIGPWVVRIKLPLHHLEEVACELNLSASFGSSHYYLETIPV